MSRVIFWLTFSMLCLTLTLAVRAQEVLEAPALTLTAPQRSVVLTWRQPVSEIPVSHYAVYKVAQGSTAWVRVAFVDALLRGWEDTAIQGGETYRYAVVAIGANSAEAPKSNIVVVTVP